MPTICERHEAPVSEKDGCAGCTTEYAIAFEKVDRRGNRSLAAELLARAAELDAPSLPEDARTMSYEAALHHVRCHSAGYAEHKIERIARRMHTHGAGHWHTAWVLYGSDGRGCSCHPCSKVSTH